ncbi:MAG: ABC transporter ATP-binding protein, partial [Acetobacteraceae bacterium]
SLIVLDEPLSNLDAKLRIEMRTELRQLQRRINATMIFVTHDQEEALFLADEVFLFNQGRVEQFGAPRDLYSRPESRYVAEFLGKANIFSVTVAPSQSGAKAFSADRQYTLDISAPPPAGTCLCMVRPEAWTVSPPAASGIPGRIVDVIFLGDRQELRVDTPFGIQSITAAGHRIFAPDDHVSIAVPPDLIRLLPEERPSR